MGALIKGAVVHHARLGRGVVLTHVGPMRVRVEFESMPTLPRTVKTHELVEGGAEPLALAEGAAAARPRPLPRVEPSPVPKAIGALDRASAWQSLEALRMGVVPSSGTVHYTVGREPELERLGALLERAEGYQAIFGDYGMGKTHLLDAAEHMARDRDFAVARLTIDPTEIAIQNPARVWGALARRIQFRGEIGLEALLEHFADSPEHGRPDGERASLVFTPCVWALRHGGKRCRGLALDHVHAEAVSLDHYRYALGRAEWTGPTPLHLPDFRTVGRVYVHLIGTLAAWIRDIGGKGLVVILDEVERVEALSTANQRWALEFQRHLASVTIPGRDLAFDPEALYAGGHSRHRDVPARFDDDQPLVALTAMTPLEGTLESFAEITPAPRFALHLAPLSDRHVKDLVARVASIYGVAYPDFRAKAETLGEIALALQDERALGSDTFRRAVRGAVARLDAARLGTR